MANIQVKSIREMQLLNRKHAQRVKQANRNIIHRFGSLNEEVSKKIAGTHSFSGELVSKIQLNEVNQLVVQVIASAPYAQEIEEGLDSPEFRKFSDYPKLRKWAEEKLKFDPRQQGQIGITVGGPGSTIHPKGLHFMLEGFKSVQGFSQQIIDSELRKIDLRGG